VAGQRTSLLASLKKHRVELVTFALAAMFYFGVMMPGPPSRYAATMLVVIVIGLIITLMRIVLTMLGRI
jgi:hypothetical protein